MKKIVVLDWIGEHFEPYDREYILDQVAGYCYRNPSILRNASFTRFMWHAYKNGAWEDRLSSVICVSFEIDEITEAKWQFLQSSIGSWAVTLKVLPDDWSTLVMYPSEFR